MKRVIFYLLCLFVSGQIVAQENNAVELSLKECVSMAVERNIHVKTAVIEQEKSEHKISENRAQLLPKININGNFQDNFKLPVTLLPGEIIGQPGTQLAANVGTSFNTSLSASFSMLLYNQTAITVVNLSKELAELNKLNVDKAMETLSLETAKLFYLAITTREQKTLVEGNIARTEDIRDITKLMLDNGFARQVDYDRIRISLENLYTQLSTVEASYEQQINMMKYVLDLSISTDIVLSGKPEETLIEDYLNLRSDFSNHVDIRILEQQKEINRLNQKTITSGYMPSLSLTGQLSMQGYRNEFKNYFNGSPENKWYNSSYIGLSLSIPVFDGFEKRSKTRQAKLDSYKTEILLEDTKDRFQVDFRIAMNDYDNNKSNVNRQQQNVNLAVKVYEETALRFKEGLASMSDLLQDEMSLNSAQSAYLTALYNFKEAELKLMSLNGSINELRIKN